MKLRIADSFGAIETNHKGQPIKKDLSQLKKLLARAKKMKHKTMPKLLDGSEVMRTLNLKPGKKVGEILRKIRDLQYAGKIKSSAAAKKFLNSLDKQNE